MIDMASSSTGIHEVCDGNDALVHSVGVRWVRDVARNGVHLFSVWEGLTDEQIAAFVVSRE